MTGGERRICPESGGNLEHGAEARGLSHLLEQLRALGQVSGGVKIFHLKQLGAGFTSAGHQFGGVDFDPVVTDPPATHAVLEGRLGTENKVCLRPAQVKEAPVHSFVDRRVLRDRRLLFGDPRQLKRGNFDLEATQFHPLIELQGTLNEDKGATGECRN